MLKYSPVFRKCLVCEKSFLAKTIKKKYCSPNCRITWEKQRYKRTVREKKIRNIMCEICGGGFSTNSHNKRFCSPKCSKTNIDNVHNEKKRITTYAIFERDDFICIYCGKSSITDGVKLVIDHIYPISAGGKSDIFNLITSCDVCNSLKHDNILKEKIVLSIWSRNQKLNKKFNMKTYKEMAEMFTRIYKYRELI